MITVKRRIPRSWFHPVGAQIRAKEVLARMPDVTGCLFLTLTLDRQLFEGPADAFEHGRDRIRRMMHKLKLWVRKETGRKHLELPYCVKTEFHLGGWEEFVPFGGSGSDLTDLEEDAEGWPHWHLIVRHRGFIPWQVIKALWDLGMIDIQRIESQQNAHYLMKYTVKDIEEVPQWVKERRRLRIWQTSRGFYEDESAQEETEEEADADEEETQEDKTTIGERIDQWEHTMTLIVADDDGQQQVRTLKVHVPVRDWFDLHVARFARRGLYHGQGIVELRSTRDMQSLWHPDSDEWEICERGWPLSLFFQWKFQPRATVGERIKDEPF
ncbi:MAG: hypothetical protein E1N59_314 [Puniceicoccaceae bacterium 5H]|nr:MAG: hypothetical protein E1N59_314 [Puniceicoccaceae bacterium 5H]